MKKKIVIIISIILVIVAVGIGMYCLGMRGNDTKKANKDESQFEIASGNISENLSSVSFYNMKPDDESLDETQQAILKYFDSDTNYFFAPVDTLQRYPQLFEQAKIRTIGGVVKVLKSTNEELELLVYEDEMGYQFGPLATDEYTLNGSTERLCIVKGEQLEERLLEKDGVNLYGRYVGVETREIDGTSYTLPVINSIRIDKYDFDITNSATKDDADMVRKVAEHIFGKDIKISFQGGEKQPMYAMDGFYQGTSTNPNYYLATLDNQSNANFKAFRMSNNSITYDKDYNNLPDTISKKLFISADFNHFIVTTYDSNLKYAYIDYFDKDLNKLWSREFEFSSNDLRNVSPIDYTQNQMAIVVDNDLCLIDLKTGENVIEPVIVGYKTKAIMMSDGIILIGNENKDLIMKVDFKGKVVYRIDGDTELTEVDYLRTQIVNGKLVVNVAGYNGNVVYENPDDYNPDDAYIEKYMVINDDGTVEYSTKDVTTYRG